MSGQDAVGGPDLTADALARLELKRVVRGYAPAEVDGLLDRIADQLERTAAELAALRERVRVAEADAERARATEATLQRTLVVAQQAAERTRADAHQAASEVRRASEEAAARRTADVEVETDARRREATVEARRIVADAEAEARRTLDAAQDAARREVEAARARVTEATERHRGLLADVVAHRDALRAIFDGLGELAVEEPQPEVRRTLVAGELDVAPRPEPLTVRVHEDADRGHEAADRGHEDAEGGPPPLGSAPRVGAPPDGSPSSEAPRRSPEDPTTSTGGTSA